MSRLKPYQRKWHLLSFDVLEQMADTAIRAAASLQSKAAQRQSDAALLARLSNEKKCDQGEETSRGS